MDVLRHVVRVLAQPRSVAVVLTAAGSAAVAPCVITRSTAAAGGDPPCRGKIVVVGRGVSGLTCALALLKSRAGADIEIWDCAGVKPTVPPNWVWEYPPYKVEPEEAANRWARESLVEFEKLSHDPAANVAMIQVVNLFYDVQKPNADHAAVLGRFAPYLSGQAALEKARSLVWPNDTACPPQFQDAVSYQAPAVAAPEYLAWLSRQVEILGGAFRTTASRFSSVDDVIRAVGVRPEIIINCTGLGSLDFAKDEKVAGRTGSLYPCKGELAIVDAPWLCTAVFADDEDWYAIPFINGSKVQLGGTAEKHVSSTEINSGAQSGILQRSIDAVPLLAKAEVVGAFAGLRPMRPSGVRLERERVALQDGGSVTVVHNYGHGGAGMICSWGCARDVVELVETAQPTE